MQEDLQDAFWYRRYKNARIYSWIIIASQYLYQIVALINPMTDEHFFINLGYMGFSIIQTALLAISHRSKKFSILALPVIILVTVRQSIRLLDLEKTKPPLICVDQELEEQTGSSLHEWRGQLVIMQVTGTTMSIMTMLYSFSNLRIIYLLSVTMTMLVTFC